MKEVYIVKADIDCGRKEIEHLEGCSYSTLADFFKDKDVKEMCKRGRVFLEELSEFTTNWNDTDDDGDYLGVMDYFIAFVFIGK